VFSKAITGFSPRLIAAIASCAVVSAFRASTNCRIALWATELNLLWSTPANDLLPAPAIALPLFLASLSIAATWIEWKASSAWVINLSLWVTLSASSVCFFLFAVSVLVTISTPSKLLSRLNSCPASVSIFEATVCRPRPPAVTASTNSLNPSTAFDIEVFKYKGRLSGRFA